MILLDIYASLETNKEAIDRVSRERNTDRRGIWKLIGETEKNFAKCRKLI